MALFNERRFFESHDVLEDVWRGLRGPARGFVQGLIQVAVAFHHLERGNRPGAVSVFTRALSRLEPCAPHAYGFDVAAHVAEITAWRELASSGASLEREPPRWHFADGISSKS